MKNSVNFTVPEDRWIDQYVTQVGNLLNAPLSREWSRIVITLPINERSRDLL